MEEESSRVRRFEETPSPEEFASLIESRNVPAVFSGCIKDWKAFSLWNPSNGGLDYLLEQVGSSTVEAMLSRTAPVFYGDIKSHERVPFPFSTFIGFCKERIMESGGASGDSIEPRRPALVESGAEEGRILFQDAPRQIYLAQVPIMNAENEERVQLGRLLEDIQTPALLETQKLASINLWMNSAQSRSSTHYDPHHNLLCIVAGCKEVTLWPPSASPYLYPMPLYGEASNHSAVALDNPDLSNHPRAAQSMTISQNVTLQAGDALFIPEGWFHQVNSEDLTIAVNFWWRSSMMSSMSEHMDSYYLRLILRRLTDKEMNQMLQRSVAGAEKKEFHKVERVNTTHADQRYVNHGHEEYVPEVKKMREKLLLHELEPLTLKALQELVSLIHDRVNNNDESALAVPTPGNGSSDRKKGEHTKNSLTGDLFLLDDDPVASVIWSLHPVILKNILLAMAHNFPRTLEAWILHLLSPVGAEVLTRKFDEMDQLNAEEDRNTFYEVFYGAFDDPSSVMDAILSGKESFALQAFKNVLDQYVGINLDGLKQSDGRAIFRGGGRVIQHS